MKLLFFSDVHIHFWSEFGAQERLQDCVSVLSEIRDYCKRSRIKYVFFGGDMFHKRGVVRTTPYVLVAQELLEFKKAGIYFYAIDGNHDQEDKAGTKHALQPLCDGELLQCPTPANGWLNVMIHGASVCVSMFSYCDNAQLLHERVKTAIRTSKQAPGHKPTYRIGLFHHGFAGARVGSTLEYTVKEPIDAKKLKLDRVFDLVFSGHFHHHQPIVGLEPSCACYIGSPLEHTRCDYDEATTTNKGFIVVEVDEEVFEWGLIPIIRPRFLKLRAGTDRITKKLVKGNFIDLQYGAETEDIQALVEEIKRAGARDVNPLPTSAAKAKETEKRLAVDPLVDPSKVLKRYVEYKKEEIAERRLDIDLLLASGLDLLHEVEE